VARMAEDTYLEVYGHKVCTMESCFVVKSNTDPSWYPPPPIPHLPSMHHSCFGSARSFASALSYITYASSRHRSPLLQAAHLPAASWGSTAYPIPPCATTAAYEFQGASYRYPYPCHRYPYPYGVQVYGQGLGMPYPCWPASYPGGGYSTAGGCTWGPQEALTYGPANPRPDILARLQVCCYTGYSP